MRAVITATTLVAALTVTGCGLMGGGPPMPAGGSAPAGNAQRGPVKPVTPEQIEAWLPATVSGLERRTGTPGPQVSEQNGMKMTMVTGIYGPPDRTVNVMVMEAPGMAVDTAPSTGSMGDQEFRPAEADGYRGQLHYVKSRRAGNAFFTVGNRFRVTVGSNNATQEEILAAARSLPLKQLDELDN